MNTVKKFLCSVALLAVLLLAASAQLAVTVSPPKIVGQKAVVKLILKNGLAHRIESARAVCFLLDDQGRMVGQSTKWVIGQNKTGLAPRIEIGNGEIDISFSHLPSSEELCKSQQRLGPG